MEITELIAKQFNHEITEQEEALLREWYAQSETNQKIYRDYCLLLKAQAIEQARTLFQDDQEAAYKKLERRISVSKRLSSSMYLFRYIAVAIVFLILGYGIKSIMPQTSDQLTEIQVPAGSKSKLILPDGTEAWLNAASRITYSSDFGISNRNIQLDGEAFFHVSKNKKLPFVLKAGNAHIHVLGTKFNIKAYNGDPTKQITLVEGSLKIATNNNQKEFLLKPDEQAIIDAANHIKIKPVKAHEYQDWTLSCNQTMPASPSQHSATISNTKEKINNTLIFDEEPLTQIVKELGRTFNVQIQLADSSIATNTYYGDFRNKENIYQILDAITQNSELKYKIESNQIIIYKSNN